MGWIETIRTRFPVETAVIANMLYALFLWTQGDITSKVAIGMALQSIIFGLLGQRQRVNSDTTTKQNEAILTNQAVQIATDASIPTEIAKPLMAPKTAAHVEQIEAQLPPKRETGP